MKSQVLPQGLHYQFPFVDRKEREQILAWLKTLKPLWEMRFSKHNPPPENDEQRPLLRPVYWLGNWQFACLDYYHPPKGTTNRCIRAESYPPLLQKMVDRIEFIAKRRFPRSYFPEKWKLNTCLVNFYGNKLENGKWVDRARVGEHKDFEPGYSRWAPQLRVRVARMRPGYHYAEGSGSRILSCGSKMPGV